MNNMECRKVGIYGFCLNDGRDSEERLQTALELWNGSGAVCAGKFREWPAGRLILHGERGKPYLRNCPGTGLSITHSGDFWMCALADTEVGIDLQEHTLRTGEKKEEAAQRYRKMAVRFFHKSEADYVLEGNSFRRFFHIWAAKEAYVKYTGQGIDDSFGDFSVVPEGGFPATGAAGQKFFRWAAGGVWFVEAPLKGYTLCVCTGSCAEPEIKWPEQKKTGRKMPWDEGGNRNYEGEKT